MKNLAAIILAAGKSTRIKSDKSKLLHEIAGEKVIISLTKTIKSLNPQEIVYVVSHQKEAILDEISTILPTFNWVDQGEPKGTAHAVQKGLEKLTDFKGNILILAGDVPFLEPESLQNLIKLHNSQSNNLISLLTFEPENPHGYGRIIRQDNYISGIVEQKELSEEQKTIRECNGGIYLVDSTWLKTTIGEIENNNNKNEFYLTDLVYKVPSTQKARGIKIDPQELLGLNTRSHFAQGEEYIQHKLTGKFMDQGVGFISPREVYLETQVKIGKDTIIEKDVALKGKTTIGKNCRIGQGSIISNSVLANNVLIKPYSVIEDSQIAKEAQIGPFSHLRPQSKIGPQAKVGNFVETKKTTLKAGVKANHLSYLGDATIGAKSNIGAGTITCNYDGTNKYQTIMEEGVFVGSDTQLIAPVTVGAGAYIASGTTVMNDIPPKALALNPKKQKNIKDWNQQDE